MNNINDFRFNSNKNLANYLINNLYEYIDGFIDKPIFVVFYLQNNKILNINKKVDSVSLKYEELANYLIEKSLYNYTFIYSINYKNQNNILIRIANLSTDYNIITKHNTNKKKLIRKYRINKILS